MKCSQSRPGFELMSPCPFPSTINITPRVPFLLYSRCFDRHALWPSSGVSCQTREPTENLELNWALYSNHRGRPFQLCQQWPYITVIVIIPCHSCQLLGLNLQPPDDLIQKLISMRHLVGKSFWVKSPEEGRKTYRPKRCEYNNKDELNSPKILCNNN